MGEGVAETTETADTAVMEVDAEPTINTEGATEPFGVPTAAAATDVETEPAVIEAEAETTTDTAEIEAELEAAIDANTEALEDTIDATIEAEVETTTDTTEIEAELEAAIDDANMNNASTETESEAIMVTTEVDAELTNVTIDATSATETFDGFGGSNDVDTGATTAADAATEQPGMDLGPGIDL